MTPRVIVSKAANCLIADAEMRGGVSQLLGAVNVPDQPLRIVLAGFKAAYGGLWVGGRLTLTEHTFAFAPNAANRLVHKDLPPVDVDLRQVQSVDIQGGFVTKIIALGLPGHVLKVRCYGAPTVAGQIRGAIAQLPR